MTLLVTPSYYGEFVNDLAEMHRLRYRVVKQRLNWNVQVSGDVCFGQCIYYIARPMGGIRVAFGFSIDWSNHALKCFPNSSGRATGGMARPYLEKQPLCSRCGYRRSRPCIPI
ncbi:acyl-homoserine-lactone synthase [Bradyrhizobium sp. 200]|uniref:acyl-homoserine-lactone synthase n=1 Tax=Bradyrhizobium sp. 200 TaxID=2782665 RepID=UPI001FFE681A|nr:acyl-homoserine-lactone synthase [Bradyrhizobium sp. 200]